MATRKARRGQETPLKSNPYCDKEKEINVVLMGQTGVGKSTFINAFVNYIVHDTLEEAVNSDMQAVISSGFSYTTPDTFEQKEIHIGKGDQYEQTDDIVKSNTQKCRSFVFPIGERNLRFIDTPGVGDTRGAEQDKKNFQEILDYIAQYEHLNAIFILLKPDEERLTITFRFCINEILRHLQVGAKDNIVFIITSARKTFYMPGSTKRILEKLLNEHRQTYHVDIPFVLANTFLFDNEAFRYLALRKNGERVNNEEIQAYTRSWTHSVKEYSRLMEYVNKCPLHATANALSLNEAEQLVRILPRPLAETTRLIEQNIQLAKDHQRKVRENPRLADEGIPQNNPMIDTLRYPRTVCTGANCRQVINDGTVKKMKYRSICHDRCYLKGAMQETLRHAHVGECEIMDPYKGICGVCKCHWDQHKHITYQYEVRRTYIKPSRTSTNITDIERYIQDLREEERQIQDVYRKMARFLHANSLLPMNDSYIDYLKYFIHEEQMKQHAGERNTESIANLQKMMTDYENEMNVFRKTIEELRNRGKDVPAPQPEEVFTLAGTLYRLPINGKKIREQVDVIKSSQVKCTSDREIFVELPAKAVTSKVMRQLKDIISS